MLDIATDLTQVSITFGCHIEHIEVDALSALRTAVNSSEIEDRIAHLKDQLDIQPDCTEEELARAARTPVALDRLAELRDLHSLAYDYMGRGVPENEETKSLLTARGIFCSRRIRSEESTCDEDPGCAGSRRVIHRVLCSRPQSQPRAHGARRTWPYPLPKPRPR